MEEEFSVAGAGETEEVSSAVAILSTRSFVGVEESPTVAFSKSS